MPNLFPRQRFFAAAAAALLVFAATGAARAQEAVSVEIFEFGIYEPGPVTGIDAPSEYGVPRIFADRLTLLESTHEIPPEPNLSFGIRYRVAGGAEGDVIPITLIVRYPPQGLQNPSRPGPSYFDENLILAPTGMESFYTWDFFEPWHIEPGIWTIELWHNGEKLDEEWFEVITPPIS